MIKAPLQIEGKEGDLTLFNRAIDSKLRDYDVVAVRVNDIAPSGYSMDRATIWQKKPDALPSIPDMVDSALRVAGSDMSMAACGMLCRCPGLLPTANVTPC
jgi:hypothetical protein